MASRIKEKVDGFHWSIFDEFQPYQGRRGRPDNWSGDYIPQLALLQLLSNHDKHRHITPILLPPTGYHFPEGVFPASAPGTFSLDPFSMAWSSEPLKLGGRHPAARPQNESSSWCGKLCHSIRES